MLQMISAFYLFFPTLLLNGFMSAYFYCVSQDNNLLNDNPTFEMIKEAYSFIENIYNDMCCYESDVMTHSQE
jgi:hypothetical protein